jgi:hypothetical protein
LTSRVGVGSGVGVSVGEMIDVLWLQGEWSSGQHRVKSEPVSGISHRRGRIYSSEKWDIPHRFCQAIATLVLHLSN